MKPTPPIIQKSKRPWFISVIVVGVIDILCILGILILSNKVAQEAEQIHELKVEKLKAEQKSLSSITTEELEKYKPDVEKLAKYYPDDETFLELVGKLDELKRQGLFTNYSFAADEAIKDKTGNLGLPVLFDIKGDRVLIENSLKSIYELPFLIKPIRLEITRSEVDGSFSVRYGSFLYVENEFGKN